MKERQQMTPNKALEILRIWAISCVDEMSSNSDKHMAEVEEALKVLEGLINTQEGEA